MALLIDGYNVLFAIAEQKGQDVAAAIEAARARLLKHLTRYSQATHDPVTLIFDQSARAGGATREEGLPGIRILYSHPPRTADDDIRRIVETSHAPQHFRVVTSDQALGRDCARLGARVVGASAFFRELTTLAEASQDDERETWLKQQPPSAAEIQEWLDAFGDGREFREKFGETDVGKPLRPRKPKPRP
jgi:predicted RNA-binding protein with PIN domain